MADEKRPADEINMNEGEERLRAEAQARRERIEKQEAEDRAMIEQLRKRR